MKFVWVVIIEYHYGGVGARVFKTKEGAQEYADKSAHLCTIQECDIEE